MLANSNVPFPPGAVALKHHRNVTCGRIFSDYRVRFNNFSTVIEGVHLVDGKYYYEIEVLTWVLLLSLDGRRKGLKSIYPTSNAK